MELEKWVREELKALEIDEVFAPYIIGMLDLNQDREYLHETILDVLLGWLSPSRREIASQFTSNLIKYFENPSKLPSSLPASFPFIDVSLMSPSMGTSSSRPLTSAPSLSLVSNASICSLSKPWSPVRGEPDSGYPYAASNSTLSSSFDLLDEAGHSAELKATASSFVPGSTTSTKSVTRAPIEGGSQFDFTQSIPSATTLPLDYSGSKANHSFAAAAGEYPAEDPTQPVYEPPYMSTAYEYEYDEASEYSNVEAESMSEEDSFWWCVGKELVEQLNYKYPEYHPQSLLEILKQVDFDIERALFALRGIYDTEQRNVTQVCRHYLQGECRRADCMFLHDTSDITCRFWIRGTCLQDEHCIFLHGCMEFESSPLNGPADSEDESEDEPLPDLTSEEKFPSLSASTAKDSSCVASPSKTSDLSMSFAKALSLKSERAQQSYGSTHKPQVYTRSYRLKSNPTSRAKWLSTGDSVAQQYRKLRQEASHYAKIRNQLFMKATTCFRDGNKKLARELSLQGNEYNQKMKECHLNAAHEIFHSRNPPEQIYEDQILDLHGLHVAEAVELMYEVLPMLAEEGLQEISIVTGTGHHSLGPSKRARIRPAVERFLTTERYEYYQVPDRKGFVGMLHVRIDW